MFGAGVSSPKTSGAPLMADAYVCGYRVVNPTWCTVFVSVCPDEFGRMTALVQLFQLVSVVFVSSTEFKPKKIKIENEKKVKKRKTEEEEVSRASLCRFSSRHFYRSCSITRGFYGINGNQPPGFLLALVGCLRMSNPKRKQRIRGRMMGRPRRRGKRNRRRSGSGKASSETSDV